MGDVTSYKSDCSRLFYDLNVRDSGSYVLQAKVQ